MIFIARAQPSGRTRLVRHVNDPEDRPARLHVHQVSRRDGRDLVGDRLLFGRPELLVLLHWVLTISIVESLVGLFVFTVACYWKKGNS